MNSKLKILPLVLTALAFLCLPILAFAHEAAGLVVDATGELTADSLVQVLTPVLVPVLIAWVKKIAPGIPSQFLPLIAPVLGVVIGLIQHAASGAEQNLWKAALLGLLGVAVREVKESFKPAPNGGWPTKGEYER